MNTKMWAPAGLIVVALLFHFGSAWAQEDLVVANVVAQQRSGTALVDVTYDLATVDALPATVSLWLSTDGGATFPYLCVTVSGDVGEGVLAGVGLHIVWDAGEDDPGFSSPTCQLRVTADDGVVFEIPDTTTIIPAEDSTIIQNYDSGGTVTLDAASQYAQDIEIGDVLIGQNDQTAPDGLLRKVIAKTSTGGSIVLETGPALMTEAFEMMDLSETYRLRPSDVKSSVLQQGTRLLPDKDGESFVVQLDCVLFDQDGDTNSTEDQVRILGEYAFTADLSGTIEISGFELRKFELVLDTNGNMDVGLSSEVECSLPDSLEFPVATLHICPIPLGGVVWVVPTLSISAYVQGEIVTLETGVSGTQEVRNGFGYANHEFYLVNDSSKDFSFTPQNFEAAFNIEPGISLDLNCGLYGVAGPIVGGNTGFHFANVIGDDPCDPGWMLDLDAIFFAVVGVNMDAGVFGLEYSQEYELYVHPIGEWVFPLCGSGSVNIDVEPDSLNASWAIAGPCSYSESGNGDAILTQLLPGEYTVTWGPVAGYLTPVEETLSLVADGTVTFSGTYIENGGPPTGFVYCPPGTFLMGSPEGELGRVSDETQHQVTLTHGFYVHSTEVTNRQYAELAQWAYNHGFCTATSASLRDNLDGSNQELLDLDAPQRFISFSGGTFTVEEGKEDHPVLEVTWFGSVAYCDWLSLQQGLSRAYNHSTWQCNGGNPYTATGYRLPTEAEWEYACRAGTQTAFNTGSCLDEGTEAIYNGLQPQVGCLSGSWNFLTAPVGSFPANGNGLFDMHGNLWEWCNDWYGEYEGTVTNPGGPATGSSRVNRGGCWSNGAQLCRSARRTDFNPVGSLNSMGFRPVKSAN